MYKRIIPIFLIRGKRLVKGTQFDNFVDVGDPLSQAMIYDAQGADEIIVVDIDASQEGRMINTGVINEMINKCRLPISAGGGIKSVKDALKCFEAGADKIVVNTSALLNPFLIKEMADEFGSQSVVVSVDVRRNGSGDYEVYAFSGKKRMEQNLKDHISTAIDLGAGEIIVTSIDREGTLSGFDYELHRRLRDATKVPIIASGGAGCYDDLVNIFKETHCDACAVGKMLFLRDYDIVKFKSYLKGRKVPVRDA